MMRALIYALLSLVTLQAAAQDLGGISMPRGTRSFDNIDNFIAELDQHTDIRSLQTFLRSIKTSPLYVYEMNLGLMRLLVLDPDQAPSQEILGAARERVRASATQGHPIAFFNTMEDIYVFMGKPQEYIAAHPTKGQSELTINVDGADGRDGSRGRSGMNGIGSGSDGRPGTDGTDGTNGANAGNISVELATSPDGTVKIKGTSDATLNLKGKIDLSAKGGDGGDGGRGGDGGDGARGYAGRDATRSSRGTDGGPGGDGARGGMEATAVTPAEAVASTYA